MEIRKTKREDIERVLRIYEHAKSFMRANGNTSQWNSSYPSASLLEQDIHNDNSYVCIDNGDIVGTFMFTQVPDPTYCLIDCGSWRNEDPYGVVHRIAVANNGRGIASFCLDWCFQQCHNIRIDTHEANSPMRTMLLKHGFVECGIIYLVNGEERIAFQKI